VSHPKIQRETAFNGDGNFGHSNEEVRPYLNKFDRRETEGFGA
jgi:hypothetical protein